MTLCLSAEQLQSSMLLKLYLWVFKNILVDIMPTEDTRILDFSNKWYTLGFENKISYILPDETEIFIFPPEIYLASKLEAHLNRGSGDLRQSHDFEDVIFILYNNPDIKSILLNSADSVKEYLKNQFKMLLDRDDILEGIECALPYYTESDSVEKIIDIMEFE